MEEQHHIASAFDRDLEEIKANVIKMGALVDDGIHGAAKALKRRDVDHAERVRKADKQIDALEQEINEECARLIALRQPIASDLRMVLTVMKIAANLERIGNYAKNLAKRTAVLVHLSPIEGANGSIRRMASEVREMLSEALDAYSRQDQDLADEVRHRDLEVDQMYNALFREFLTFMMEDPRSISACMHYHFIAKNIERMGDHVTAIADQVIYLVSGEMPEEARPKGMRKAYEVPEDGTFGATDE